MGGGLMQKRRDRDEEMERKQFPENKARKKREELLERRKTNW